MVLPAPESWNAEQIEHRYNQGSWCADNLLAYIERWQNVTGKCMCSNTVSKFIREATIEDEIEFGSGQASKYQS